MSKVLIKWEDLKKIIEFGFLAFYNKKYRSRKERWKMFQTLTKLYLLSKGNKANKITEIDFFDFKVKGFNSESLFFLFNEIFLSKDYLFHSENKTPIIIDCGSNIGVSVLYFKMIYPDAVIHAFEPNPKSFEYLKHNVQINNLQNVYLNNCALSNVESEIEMFFSESTYGSLTTSLIQERGGISSFMVKSMKLSNYLKDLKVDLIKIDVEGAEDLIIEDLILNYSLNNSKNYIIEFHLNLQENYSSFPLLINNFIERNFVYNLKSNFYKINTFQDVLLYFYEKKS